MGKVVQKKFDLPRMENEKKNKEKSKAISKINAGYNGYEKEEWVITKKQAEHPEFHVSEYISKKPVVKIYLIFIFGGARLIIVVY